MTIIQSRAGSNHEEVGGQSTYNPSTIVFVQRSDIRESK